MRKFGVNLMVWSGTIGTEELALLPAIAQMGYEGVELPIFAPEAIDTALIQDAVQSSGLVCTVCTALPEGVSLLDDTARSQSVDWLGDVIACASALNAEIVCGPLGHPVGAMRGRGYLPAEWDSCVDALKTLGNIAAEHDVVLAHEPLNRFETFFVNTVADGVRLVEAVDHPNVGLLLDTFHQHIEEKSTEDAIRHAGAHIKHFHASENDRGIVGSGQIGWPKVIEALDAVDYDQWVVLESFNAVIPELAGATCIWRKLADSPDQMAQTSLDFLVAHLR